jgi:hypothetical protein
MEAGSRSMLLPPPNASTYSLQVDPRFLHHGGSYLSAALEQSMVLAQPGGAAGHLAASATSASQRGGTSSGMGAGAGRLNLFAQWNPADSGMQLVARARRSLPQPASIAQQMRMQPALTPPGERCSACIPASGCLLYQPSSQACSCARHQTCAAHRKFSTCSSLPFAAAVPTAAQPASTFSGNGGIRDAMSAALATGLDASGQHVAPWYPRGVLVAHLAEHKK